MSGVALNKALNPSRTTAWSSANKTVILLIGESFQFIGSNSRRPFRLHNGVNTQVLRVLIIACQSLVGRLRELGIQRQRTNHGGALRFARADFQGGSTDMGAVL